MMERIVFWFSCQLDVQTSFSTVSSDSLVLNHNKLLSSLQFADDLLGLFILL